jgi:hypothetical protein
VPWWQSSFTGEKTMKIKRFREYNNPRNLPAKALATAGQRNQRLKNFVPWCLCGRPLSPAKKQ